MILLVLPGLQIATVLLLLPRLVPIYQMTILTDAFVRVIVSSIQTNRARCTLYKKIPYSTKKAFLEKAVVELVYKIDEKSYRESLIR